VTLGTISAGGDVAISAQDDGLIVTEDIGAGGHLALDTPYTIEFQTPILTAGQDILLNTNIPANAIKVPANSMSGSPPLLATIFRAPGGTIANPTAADLTLQATSGNIEFGEGQKLSVPGVLNIRAADGAADVTLADVAAMEFHLKADQAFVYGRGGQPLYNEQGVIENDTQGDIVANLIEFDLSGPMQLVMGTGPAPIIANQYGDPVPNSPAGSPPGRALTNSDLLTPANFIGVAGDAAGEVLDRRADGIPNLGTSQVPPIPEEVTLSGGLLSELNQAARRSKPVWGSEVAVLLTCSLYEGEALDTIPAECQEYAKREAEDPRLQTEPIVEARKLYQQLYQDVDPMLDALQDAADAYLESAPSGPISGEAFRQFLERSPEQDAALGYLRHLRTLFDLLDEATATDGDTSGVGELRDQLLDDITPAGMSPAELNDAIEATPPTPRQAKGESELAAMDGVPLAAR
jgi:hypothetical protein